MNKPLSIHNWSLKKALETVPDSFDKARIRIIITILAFSLLKIFVAIGFSYSNGQLFQLIRGLIALLFYVSLTKVLLSKPSSVVVLAHIMLLIGTAIVWTNIFIYAHNINLATVQFAYMVVLSSFYTLGKRHGIFYSILSILPMVLSVFLHDSVNLFITNSPQPLASPGYEIIVLLNFASIILVNYLFYDAFQANITEKELLNNQLQASIIEANKLSESKSNFLSTMSHELRTPLNSVIGVTELLLEDNPEERQKENLKILQSSTLDLLSLINNILDYNKTNSDKLTLENVPFNLEDLIQSRCAGLKVKANDKNLNFILDIDEKIKGITVVSDPTRLSQLIYNLVGNAIKFTERGSITVKLDCEHRSPGTVEILFSIIDTGIGIAHEKHQNIFDIFTQAEPHTTRKYGGSGLGLAIVKQILSLFNSEIILESTPDVGSKFQFAITFNVASDSEVNFEKDKVTDGANFSDLKILIAEDNEINRLIIKKQFDKLGITPLIVADGKQAHDAYLLADYDVIFMDLHMPVLDGYATTRRIRALEDKVKAGVYIIAFTASVTEQQQISEAGFDDYLYKPVNMKDLRDKLEKVKKKR